MCALFPVMRSALLWIPIMRVTVITTITINMAVLNPSSIQKRAVVNGRAIPGDDIPKGLAHQMHALLKKADGKSIDLKTVISVISGRSHAAPILGECRPAPLD
jgi:hypothetical protein